MVSSMARTPHRWASLIELDVERIDWLSIAEHLPGRNNKECRKHWHQKFATNTNYGSWTDKEDERLHMAIGQHGTKWALVAQAVGTRSSEQCSKRWNDVLNPDLNRSPWTDEDVCIPLSPKHNSFLSESQGLIQIRIIYWNQAWTPTDGTGNR